MQTYINKVNCFHFCWKSTGTGESIVAILQHNSLLLVLKTVYIHLTGNCVYHLHKIPYPIISDWFSQFQPVTIYRIAGNFHEVQIFTIFATHDQNAKIRTAKYEPRKCEHVNFWKFLPRAFYALVSLNLTSDDGTIALFQTGRRRPTLSHGISFVLC